MTPRTAVVERETRETRIRAELNLDGRGAVEVRTGVGFFDHMLTAAMMHGFFDLTLTADGDHEIDDHHTVEDAGIVLGQAFSQALGDFSGIRRFGEATVPMDDALARAAVDLCRRPFLVFHVPTKREKVGRFDTQLIEEFWRAFVNACGATLHIDGLRGKNMHHLFEAAFKAAGRALDRACQLEPRSQGALSSKGTL